MRANNEPETEIYGQRGRGVVKAQDCQAIANELVTKVYLNRSSTCKPAAISLATLPLSSIANELYLNSALLLKCNFSLQLVCG